MKLHEHLNGYMIPYSVITVLISLFGLIVINSCNRVSALEVTDQVVIGRVNQIEAIDAIRVKRLEEIAADVSLIKVMVLETSIRQEAQLRLQQIASEKEPK